MCVKWWWKLKDSPCVRGEEDDGRFWALRIWSCIRLFTGWKQKASWSSAWHTYRNTQADTKQSTIGLGVMLHVCVCVLWQTTCCDWFTDLYSTPKTISDPVTTYTAIINEKTSSRPDSTDFHSGAQFCQTPHYWKDFLFKKAISPVKCFISVTCTHKQNTLNHPFPNVQKSWQNQQIVPYLLPVCVWQYSVGQTMFWWPTYSEMMYKDDKVTQ